MPEEMPEIKLEVYKRSRKLKHLAEDMLIPSGY